MHEIFDEYYSVSLDEDGPHGEGSTRIPHQQPAVGYRKGRGIAEPDPERAPFVVQLFERYATGRYTDRSLAEWLNSGQRTAKGRLFGADTVREMLGNAAYCGYVSARRDKSRSIRDKHESLVD